MELHDLFYYDPTSPTCLRWKVTRGCRIKGSVAGCLEHDKRNGRKTYRVNYNNRLNLVHRIIYQLHHGLTLSKTDEIDHIDGNSLNNSIENLRVVDRDTNTRNARKRKDNKTGVTGVTVRFDKAGNLVYTAIWKENKQSKRKSFSSSRYGDKLAFQLACEYRQYMINFLNQEGKGYTDRHGT